MKHLRIALIGCGVIGRQHALAVVKNPSAKLQVVCDLREKAARDFAEEFKAEESSADPLAVLDHPKVDAVILALPAGARGDLAVAAFKSGKHVLVEKPAALSVKEIDQIIQAKGKLVGATCSSRYRGLASAIAAAECISSGALGKIRVISCRALSSAGPAPTAPPPPWRLSRSMNGGGILVNWGSYDLDYLLGILRFRPEPRFALANVYPVGEKLLARVASGSDAETHFSACVTFQDGSTLMYERGEFTTARVGNLWEIVGAEGSLSLQMVPGKDKRIVLNRVDPTLGIHSETVWEGNETDDVHHIPVNDFVDCIGREKKPLTSLEDARLIQRITDAIYDSACGNQPVAVGK